MTTDEKKAALERVRAVQRARHAEDCNALLAEHAAERAAFQFATDDANRLDQPRRKKGTTT